MRINTSKVESILSDDLVLEVVKCVVCPPMLFSPFDSSTVCQRSFTMSFTGNPRNHFFNDYLMYRKFDLTPHMDHA